MKTIQEIIQSTRTLLNDRGYNSNSSNDDRFYKDDYLIELFNDAVSELNFKCDYFRFDDSDTDFKINILQNQRDYILPSNLTKYFTITIGDNILQELKYKDYNEIFLMNPFYPNFSTVPSQPSSYYVDYSLGKIRFYETPDKNYTATLRGVKDIPFFDSNNLLDDLTVFFKEKHISFFKYYIASKCLEIIDTEDTNIKLSQYFYERWKEYLRRIRVEIFKLKGLKNAGFYDDEYNV